MSGCAVRVVIPLDDAGAKTTFNDLAGWMRKYVRGPDTNSYFLELVADKSFFRDVENITYLNTSGATACGMIRKIEQACRKRRRHPLIGSFVSHPTGMTLTLTLADPNKAMLFKLAFK